MKKSTVDLIVHSCKSRLSWNINGWFSFLSTGVLPLLPKASYLF